MSYTKADSGTGAGNFANSTLYLMSRAGSALFGTGDLDELAIYNRRAERRRRSPSTPTATAPTGARSPRFTTTPNPRPPNQTVTFDASGSSDPDGSITKYEWDLDGNGTYETDTGTSPTVDHDATPPRATYNVGLRVTDSDAATDVDTNDRRASSATSRQRPPSPPRPNPVDRWARR